MGCFVNSRVVLNRHARMPVSCLKQAIRRLGGMLEAGHTEVGGDASARFLLERQKDLARRFTMRKLRLLYGLSAL